MLQPIKFVLRLQFSLLRWTRRRRLPDWLRGISTLIEFADVPAYCLTFFYTTFYPRHFYRRVGVMSRLETVDDRVVYPYLQRPIPYLVTYLIIIGILGHYGIAPFGALKSAMDKAHLFGVAVPDDIQFSLGVLVSTVLVPVLIVVYFVLLIALLLISLHLMAGWLLMKTRGKDHTGIHLNWRLIRTIFRDGFWRNYRYRELVPALLYYNANAIILGALTFYIFRTAWEGLRHTFSFNSMQSPYLVGIIVVLTLRYFHALIMRPLLYAVLFRSDRSALRHGYFPEVLIWGPLPKRPPAEVYPSCDYLDDDLLPCAPEGASFVCQKLVDKKRRPAGRRITPLLNIKPALESKEIARRAGSGG